MAETEKIRFNLYRRRMGADMVKVNKMIYGKWKKNCVLPSIL